MKNYFDIDSSNPIEVQTPMDSNQQEMLPAVEVDNRVIFVNSEIESPFKIEEGMSTELGVFFTPDPKNEKIKKIEVVKDHGRSGILGRVIFKDKQGRLYRDVDLKGIGYIFGEINEDNALEKMVVRPIQRIKGMQTRGIADMSYVQNDLEMSEEFLNAGIRTYRIIAITELKELVDASGNKIPVDNARKQHIIKKNDKPVIEIRAFGVRTRIGDLMSLSKLEKESLIEDAMKWVVQEQNNDIKDFSKQNYFNWFIECMAINFARMQHKGWVHGYLTDNNITLDARIIDLDSVDTIEGIEKQRILGEIQTKSFEKDFQNVLMFSSYLKGALGLMEENIAVIDYIDGNTKEKIMKVYAEETERLEKNKDFNI